MTTPTTPTRRLSPGRLMREVRAGRLALVEKQNAPVVPVGSSFDTAMQAARDALTAASNLAATPVQQAAVQAAASTLVKVAEDAGVQLVTDAPVPAPASPPDGGAVAVSTEEPATPVEDAAPAQ